MGGFLPGKKFGGPPISVNNFCSLLKNDAKCYIVTTNHDMGDSSVYENIQEGWNDRDNSEVLYLDDDDYCERTFVKIVNEIHPDYLYLQGLFQYCIFPCLKIAQRNGIKVVLSPRGELCAGAFKKKYKKLPYIWLFRILGLFNGVEFQSTSEEETVAIHKILGVSVDHIHCMTNIPSIPHYTISHLSKTVGIARFVFVSRILWKKNLLSAIKYFKCIHGSAILDIYGPIEDEKYWHECESAIKALPVNVKVNYKGVVSHDEIHKIFSEYDAFIFPTFSENYGHVIIEALMSGCIPIISNQTPWSDMNSIGAGWSIPLDKPVLFENAIQDVIDMDENAISLKRRLIDVYIDNKLKLRELKRNYLELFK